MRSTKLTVLREKLGWSKTKLGFAAQVHPAQVGKIEGRRVKAYPCEAARIAQALGAAVDELLGPDGWPLEVE